MNFSLRDCNYEELKLAFDFNDHSLKYMVNECERLMPSKEEFNHRIVDMLLEEAEELIETQRRIIAQMTEFIGIDD